LGTALRGIVFLVLLLISVASFVTPSSYAAVFDLTELKAYYTFEEESGDLINEAANAGSIDSLGSEADGKLETGVTQGQTGLIGNSYEFPGASNGQVELGTSKSQFRFLHDSPTMKWSVNIWLSTTDISFIKGIFTTGGCSTSDVGMDLLYDGSLLSEKIVVTLPQGISGQQTVVALFSQTGILAADGQWHMISVTHDHDRDDENMKLYVDGVFKEFATKNPISPINSNHDEVGTIGTCEGLPYNGFLDEFSIWNRILNPSEILDLYNNGAGLSFIDNNQVIGGEIIPIENTSLILAGAQSFSWMIPVVLSGIGIGLFVASRKSE